MTTQETATNDATADGPVTRSEILRHVEGALEHPPVASADLVEATLRSSARRPLAALLEGLPDRRFSRPNDLWEHLPEGPLGE